MESHACPMSTCAAPAGSPCRTGKGKVAIQYHTARFRLVSQLANTLSVPTPAVRKPARPGPSCPGPRAPAPSRSDTYASGPAPRPPGSP
ncbi:zinc finger domain-containing protein [Streptomyces sp. NPDC003006]